MRCKNHEQLGWDDPDCITCKSITKHNNIYGHLNSVEQMKLFKERTAKAFDLK